MPQEGSRIPERLCLIHAHDTHRSWLLGTMALAMAISSFEKGSPPNGHRNGGNTTKILNAVDIVELILTTVLSNTYSGLSATRIIPRHRIISNHAIRIVNHYFPPSQQTNLSTMTRCEPRNELTLTPLPRPTPNPHPTVHNPRVPLIARLQLNRQSKRILARVHAVRLRRVKKSLHHFAGARPPPGRLHGDESWRGVVGAEEVVC